MNIDWAAFGEVFLVSLGAAVGVVVVFAIGVALISDRAPVGADRAPTRAAKPHTGSQALAGLCFLACALIVVYGLYLVIHK
jgi:hypothetical protein